MIAPKFLIDECLAVDLAGHAHSRGYRASHLRDLGLLGRKDSQLAPIIFENDWCFITRNARDFRGPADAPGAAGEYAGVPLHAGLICLHGPPTGFDITAQIEAFDAALDTVEAECAGDPTNRLIEITWTPAGIGIEVFDFPSEND